MAYIKFFAKDDEEAKHEVKLFSYIEQRYKRIFFDAFSLIFVFALIPDFDNFAEISLLGILLLALTYKNDHKLIYGLLKLSSVVALLIVSCTELYTDGGVGLSIIPIALGLIYHVPRTLIDIVKKFKEFKNNKEDKMLNLESYMGVDLLFV
ncbi:MAG: hypothetical protein MJ246_00240 [Clostridia bacterium]|nr:hypothetical protein [Clostridia bacterium]